jgi:hypothetical protein
MSLPLDGSCDGELKVKGLEGLEIGDWRKIAGPAAPLEQQDFELAEEGDEMEIQAADL